MSRIVRTPEGADFYGQPIGSVIKRDLPKAILKPSVDLPTRVNESKRKLGKGWDSDSVEVDDKHTIHRLSKPGSDEKHYFLEKRVPAPRKPDGEHGEPLVSARPITKDFAMDLHDSMEDLSSFEDKDPSKFGDNSVREIVGLLDSDFGAEYSPGEKKWLAEATKRAEESNMGIDEWVYGPKALQASGERRVRTPEGEKFYGQPIGSVIVPNTYLVAGVKKAEDLKPGDFIRLGEGTYQVRKSPAAKLTEVHVSLNSNHTIRAEERNDVLSVPHVYKKGERVTVFKLGPKGAKATLDVPNETAVPKAKFTVFGKEYSSRDSMQKQVDALDAANQKYGESDDRVTEKNALEAEIAKDKAGFMQRLAEHHARMYPGTSVEAQVLARKMRIQPEDVEAVWASNENRDSLARRMRVQPEDVDRIRAAKKTSTGNTARGDTDGAGEGITPTKTRRPAKKAAVAPVERAVADLPAAKKAVADAQTEMEKHAGGSPERKAAFEKYRAKLDDHNAAIKKIEAAGLGHTIPDDGPTLRVANQAQKILLEKELLGQISDGMWENSRGWEDWSNAKIIVDPNHVGRNFRATKDNYNLNSSALLDIVGERMLEEVKASDPTYDEKKMKADLASLKKIFKTSRPDFKPKAASEAPKVLSDEDKVKLTDADVKERRRVVEQRKASVTAKKTAVSDPAGSVKASQRAKKLAAPAPKSPATKAPSPAFVSGRGTSLGEVNNDAKGDHPDRFTPKESFPDGTVPQSGARVRDASGRTGTVAETYQLYTAVNWDDGSKKVVRNNKLNALHGNAHAAQTAEAPKAAAPAAPAAPAKKAAAPSGGDASISAIGREAEAAIDDQINRGEDLVDGDTSPAAAREIDQSLNQLKRKKERLAELRSDAESGKITWDEYRADVRDELHGLLGEDGPVEGDPIGNAYDKLDSPKPPAGGTPGGARAFKSARELADEGVSGKELRDALRRENPNFSNAQAHVVANKMAAEAPDRRLAAARKTPQNADSRKILAQHGEAMPDGSFPTPNRLYFQKAVRAVGRANESKRPAVREYLKKRADALGMATPDSWNDSVRTDEPAKDMTAKQMVEAGITGKPLRDQLRKENPHFTNAQTHLVSKKMEAAAEAKKASAPPNPDELGPDDLLKLQMQLTPGFPDQSTLTKDALASASVPQLTTLLKQIQDRMSRATAQQKPDWQHVMDLVAAEAKRRLGKA